MSRSSVTIADRRTTPYGGAEDRRAAGGHGRAAGETVAVVGGGTAAREAARLLRDESLGVVEIGALDGERGVETRSGAESAPEPLVGASVVVLEAADASGAADGAAEAQLEVLSRISPEAAAIVLAPPGAALPDYDRLGPHRPRVVSAPVTRESLLSALDAALSYRNLLRENRALRSELRTHTRLNDWVGSSPASAAIRGAIVTAAFSETPVLLLGEPGSGLRLAAELAHRLSRRAAQPFLALDASSLPAGELGLFFTGLRRAAGVGPGEGRAERRAGATVGDSRALRRDRGQGFEAEGRAGATVGDSAAGPPGSVYLGGISGLGTNDQAALEEALRRPPPFRLLVSADPGIRTLAREGRFSPRLLRKLEALAIRVAPLRERREDVPELTLHFLSAACREKGVGPFGIPEAAMRAYGAYRWPGNTAELKGRVGRAVAMAAVSRFEGAVLPEALCPLPETPGAAGFEGGAARPLKAVVNDFEKSLITRALRRFRGNQKETAKALGVNPTTLHEKMKRLGLLRRKRTPEPAA